MKQRLQKIMSQRGVSSRRSAEQLILDGRVTVNGHVVTKLGSLADPETDAIVIDGRPLPRQLARRVIALNKPVGYLCTRKPHREESRTIYELIPQDRRYFSIGRLDRDTAGLILLTDDGDLAHRLSHPRFGARKTYVVETDPPLDRKAVNRLTMGIRLDDGFASAIEAEIDRDSRIRIVLGEGRKRQIRRMISAVGATVITLNRIEIGSLKLGQLKPGDWRDLTPIEIESLITA